MVKTGRSLSVSSKGDQVFTAPAALAGSFEWIATAAGIPSFVLDLRSVPRDSALSNVLAGPVPLRNMGAIYSAAAADAFFGPHTLRDELDALIFVAHTTAARPNPGAPLHAHANLTIAAPANLDFEVASASGTPAQWIVPETAAAFDYAIGSSDKPAHDGARAAVIRRAAGEHYGETAGTSGQRIDATPYRGKHGRASAYSRRTAGTPSAYVYRNVTAGNAARRPMVFRVQQHVTSEQGSSTSWRRTSRDAVDIEYGLALAGDGEAWIDTVSVTTPQ